MGIVGKYIDQESDSNKDIIIEAMNWTKQWVSDVDPSCHCLIGHINAIEYNEFSSIGIPNIGSKQMEIGIKVDKMFERFDMNKIVAMFKARAAKHNKTITVEIDIHELQDIVVEVVEA